MQKSQASSRVKGAAPVKKTVHKVNPLLTALSNKPKTHWILSENRSKKEEKVVWGNKRNDIEMSTPRKKKSPQRDVGRYHTSRVNNDFASGGDWWEWISYYKQYVLTMRKWL